MYRIAISLLFFFFPCALSAWNCDSLLLKWSAENEKPLNERKTALQVIIQKALTLDNCSCLSNSYRRMGTLMKDVGQLDSAVKAYLLAVKFAKKANDGQSLASGYNQLGAIYYQLGKNKQAFDYFQQAFKANEQEDSKRGMADARINCAFVLFDENKLEEAEALCLEGMALQRKNLDTNEIGANYALLAAVAVRRKQQDFAARYFRIALEMEQAAKQPKRLVPVFSGWAQFCVTQNRYDTAVHYFRKAFQLATDYGLLREQEETSKQLAYLYARQGLTDSAFVYLDSSWKFRDSLYKATMVLNTLEMTERFRADQKEELLLHEKALSNERLLVIILLLVLLFVFAIGVVFLLRTIIQRRKLREKETALQSANAMLEGQDNERERIARELHDRIGSMLSAVKLQFSSMEEQFEVWKLIQRESYTKALQMLDDTYEEVRRISHDLDTGLLSRFGLRTAMRQLVQVISSTNKLKVVFIDNDLDPLCYKPYETDLYRITQELLSNTIKYAGASEVSIQLSRSDNKLIYSYEDDGAGFDKTQLDKVSGIGFKNIFHRIARNNGTWQLETSPGYGLNLIIELNCHEGNTGNNS